MDSLIKIFQSGNGEIRLKILRFFLANADNSFKMDEIEERTKIKRDKIKKEVAFLSGSSFLDRVVDGKGYSSFRLNNNFEHKEALYDLVFDFQNINKKLIIDKLKKIGRIKLLYFTGVFVNDVDADIDIVIVADNMKQKEINRAISDLNSIFANKLRLLIMDVEEFDYRYKMFDRFLRLVLEGRKIVIVDKLAGEF
ncbi:MAG: hypothetical protein U0469_00250 [Candidatus Paceibacterota bacterium]|jgi:hypothetical protein